MIKNLNTNTTKTPWQHKIVELISYLSILIVPLIISNNYVFPVNIPKIIIIILLSTIALFFYLWGVFYQKKVLKISFLSLILLTYILVLTISSLKGVDPINSFFGWRNTTPLFSIYALFVHSLIISSLISKDQKIVPKLFLSSFVSGIIAMIIFYTGIKGVELGEGSTLGNSSYLGTYLMFSLFFGIGLFFYYKKILQRILLLLGSLFIIISPIFINKNLILLKVGFADIFNDPLLLLGIANGATLGIALSFIFMLSLLLILSRKKFLKVMGMLSLFVLLFMVIFVGKQLSTEGSKINNIFKETKTSNRFFAWDVAKNGFKENVVWGNGYNNYIYSFDKYYNSQIYQEGYFPERFFKPHNVFWEHASETGIIGVSSYLLLMITLFGVFIAKKKNEDNRFLNSLRVIIPSLLFGYFIQNLFVFDTISSYQLVFLLLSVGMSFSGYYEVDLINKQKKINKVLVFLIMIMCFFVLYFFVFKPEIESRKMFNRHWRDNIQNTSVFGGVMDDTFLFSRILESYQKNLYKINEENKIFYLKDIDFMVLVLEEDIKKQKYYSEAYLLKSQLLNFYLMVEMKEGNRVKFNGNNYNKRIWDKSFKDINKSLELNPNNPKSYLVLSQLYMLKADFENARLYNKKALELAPNYQEAIVLANNLLKIFPNKEFENFLKK